MSFKVFIQHDPETYYFDCAMEAKEFLREIGRSENEEEVDVVEILPLSESQQ